MICLAPGRPRFRVRYARSRRPLEQSRRAVPPRHGRLPDATQREARQVPSCNGTFSQRTAGRRPRNILFSTRDMSNEAIAASRDRLDEAWLFGVITECTTQFRDGARQYVLADKRVGPDALHQSLLGNHLPGMLGQTEQDLHHLRLEMSRLVRPSHRIELRLYTPIADAKFLLH